MRTMRMNLWATLRIPKMQAGQTSILSGGSIFSTIRVGKA